MGRAIAFSLIVACAPPALAAKKELVTAASNAAASVGITPAQQAQMQSEAARLKGLATQELSNLSNNAKGIQAGLQNGITADQVGKVSAQSQQALTGLMSNPEAMAAAAKAGVTPQQLNSMQSGTDAALKGVKAGEEKARQLLDSEQGTKLKADVRQTLNAVESDPELRRQAAEAGTQAKSAALKTYTDLKAKGFTQDAIAEKMGLTPEQVTTLKTQASQAAAQVGASAESLKEKAKAALVKFCKKYEGQENVPARCRKAAKTAPIQ